jgi:glycosyltransferase involved in cell wall biosynthesis
MIPEYLHLRVARVGRYGGQFWEQFELPIHSRNGVLFTPCGGAPILHKRNIITIHDAAVVAAPNGYSRAFRTWYRFLNKALCKLSLHILTVSNFSKAELIRWYSAKPESITVSYLGADHAARIKPEPDVLRKHRLRPFNYVLAVASRNPNKNLDGLLKSLPYLAEQKIQLAVAGLTDAKVFGKLRIEDDQICDLGYVTDSELRSLYENASCFVFPSFYEGFGLPPLEALALGCPVVVADSAALSEIFRPQAQMCDPNDPVDIADKILRAGRDLESKRVHNQEFARRFEWKKCARSTWEVIARFAESS